MPRDDLEDLLSQLDEETRARWARYLEEVDAEISEKGPQVLRDHLEAALEHLLAVGWAIHRCYANEEAHPVLGPLGDAATTVEHLRGQIDRLPKKPEWSQ